MCPDAPPFEIAPEALSIEFFQDYDFGFSKEEYWELMTDMYKRSHMHLKNGVYGVHSGVRQGDKQGPALFRRGFDLGV
jgi:hypothetical protein